ncbi:MAG TPA: hypothetical protein VMZ29_05790 [Candidatus Bathyarchaeia archaeon]|nr:hypothetical protein [Candidatus Bathyarchaeia archaeon]
MGKKTKQALVIDEKELYNDNYDKEEFSNLIQQYQIYINGAETNSAQRAQMNAFFITANSMLMIALGVLIDSTIFEVSYIIYVLGEVLSWLWLFQTLNYKKLGQVKWRIVNKIEEKLAMKPYDYEWQLHKRNNPKQKSYSDIEIYIATIFIVAYPLLAILTAIFAYVL